MLNVLLASDIGAEEKGMTQGKARMLVDMVDNFVTKNSVPFETALDMLSVTQKQYEEAKALLP